MSDAGAYNDGWVDGQIKQFELIKKKWDYFDLKDTKRFVTFIEKQLKELKKSKKGFGE